MIFLHEKSYLNELKTVISGVAFLFSTPVSLLLLATMLAICRLLTHTFHISITNTTNTTMHSQKYRFISSTERKIKLGISSDWTYSDLITDLHEFITSKSNQTVRDIYRNIRTYWLFFSS